MNQLSAEVNCFVKGAHMTARRWQIAIFAASVLVMTPQQLLNMLRAEVASLQQISLLVSHLVSECDIEYQSHTCFGSAMLCCANAALCQCSAMQCCTMLFCICCVMLFCVSCAVLRCF